MNNLVRNNTDIDYIKSDNILQDIQQIIEKSQRFAWQTINIAMVQRNWLLGKRIAEEELQGENRAKYGAPIPTKILQNILYYTVTSNFLLRNTKYIYLRKKNCAGK
jgi:hypothetical protein